MYRKFFSIIAVSVSLWACSKSSSKASYTCPYTAPTAVASASEIATLKAFLDSSKLDYHQLPSGLFYKIVTQGAGDTATVCSAVLVKYKGQLLNGTGFDSSYVRSPNGTAFNLGGVITGWQYGIPLIQKGGSIILYVPPSLGYGTSANGIIPANSNLIFNVDLLDLQK